MNAFPLAPFLSSLEAERIRVTLADYDRIAMVLRAGGPWTLGRLRGALLALLAKSENDESIIRRTFDGFFDLKLAADREIKEEELREALAEINQLLNAPDLEEDLEPGLGRGATGRKGRHRPPPKRKLTRIERVLAMLRHPITVLVSVALIVFFSFVAWTGFRYLYDRFSQPLQPNTPIQETSEETERTAPEPFTLSATEANIAQLPSEHNWKDYAVAALLATSLLWSLFVLYRLLIDPSPEERRPTFAPDAPGHFARGEIGGPPAPQLNEATLTGLADSLGFFRSELPGQMLDADASVKAVVENGGMPVLVFHRRKHLRTVLVMEDVFAEPRAWNTVAGELAEGLARRGVPVLHGRFDGVPSAFDAEGHTLWLDDLDNNRRDYLLLIFSDGKGIGQHDVLTLETLSRWPMAAWMELREPSFWDESTARVVRHGIPVYAATAEGLTQVLNRFLTEQGASRQGRDGDALWLGAPAFAGGGLAPYVEKLLGDSLPWAQACAMIQPVTLGLADALRRRFQPHLPPERVGRLMYLPGTTHSVLGIRFSTPVLSVLRAGFAARWETSKQEEILTFILEKLKEVEPERADSLAHLAWEATFERVRLELEPEAASRRLASLDRTPLHDFIRAELENVKLPGDGREPESEASALVPLRVAPRDDRALQQLAHIADKVKPPPTVSRLILFVKRLHLRLTHFTNLTNGLVSSTLSFLGLYDPSAYSLFHTLMLRLLPDRGLFYSLRLTLRILERSIPKPLGIIAFPYYVAIFPLIRVLSKIRVPSKTQRDQTAGLVIAPSRIDFGVVWQNWHYRRRLFVMNSAGGEIGGKASTDRDWLVVRPRNFAVFALEQFIVRVNTEGMLPGIHTGTVTLDTSAGRQEVGVSMTVFAFDWKEFLPWENFDRRAMLRWLSLLLPLVLIAAFVVPRYLLSPNWVNRWYNQPPVLNGISPGSGGTLVVLYAVATDPDGDSLTYRWETDVTSRGAGANGVSLDFSGVDVSLVPPAVNVKLTVEDARGGNSVYNLNVPLQTTTAQSDPENGPPSGDETTGARPAQTDAVAEAGTSKIILTGNPGLNVQVRDSKGKTVATATTTTASYEVSLEPGKYSVYLVYGSGPIPVRSVLLRRGASVQLALDSYPSGKTGRLRIPELNEDTTILIDGKEPSIDTSAGWPSALLTTGRHTVTFRINGFDAGSTTVVIDPDATKTISEVPRGIPVTILVDQPDTEVLIRRLGQNTRMFGEPTGTLVKLVANSLTETLSRGHYIIACRKDGFISQVQSLQVSEASHELTFKLRPAADSPSGDASFQPAQLISSNIVPYPASLPVEQSGNLEVAVTVSIDESGKVTAANVEGQPSNVSAAATAAVAQFKFKPATRGGKAVADTLSIKLVFKKQTQPQKR